MSGEPRAQVERDAFVQRLMPLMLGTCERAPDGSAWCKAHQSFWAPRVETCSVFAEQSDFAEGVIEAWEGRAPLADTPESVEEKMRLGMKVAGMLASPGGPAPTNEGSTA